MQRIRLAAVRLSGVDLRQADFLDDAERRLAWTFASREQRERFLAGRIALRGHAAEAAGVDVRDLQADFVCRECSRDDHVHGMPRYQASPRKVTVLASLSRAGDWCLLAASTDGQVLGVGVDLESGVAADFEGFGQVALSARERDELQKVEPALQPGFQTRLWTRKEAVLKALGRGLAVVDPALVDVAGSVPLLLGQEESHKHWVLDAVDPSSLGLPGSFTATMAVLLGPELGSN
ncbi:MULTISPECIES: 4'-phosphopantetheinyl transferase family protein [unclassified Arthrobacter]|uniref:4'-phosphopantetheinyl transferase family protein n=1 Tax=unclassified Arthrobacter TaxID=235627 RepID=UPI001F008E8F|nr:4'-phosphopantetheinyl transferase superfamily protein [Arthrobacter sp. FW305-BF8]UKA52339.1 4'-phosphopantetheinyl transferase superfamily protein [Arthrobacter sp. FW305-BF8]